MAKNTKRGLYEVRNALYEALNEVELENSVQISQNNRKIEDLADDIVSATAKLTYSEFLSELYFRVMQMKDAITSEIAAIKNNSYLQNGYVLAINT